jgi:hypothetical protein
LSLKTRIFIRKCLPFWWQWYQYILVLSGNPVGRGFEPQSDLELSFAKILICILHPRKLEKGSTLLQSCSNCTGFLWDSARHFFLFTTLYTKKIAQYIYGSFSGLTNQVDPYALRTIPGC